MKYRFYTDNNGKTICVSSYAGKPVKGVAKCAAEDTYNPEIGRKLAQARCDAKVARKRYENAIHQFVVAKNNYEQIYRRVIDMKDYMLDSENAFDAALIKLKNLEDELLK